ncbi:LacI family DNA-binding transcriptional regulator [Marinihelvus fidelis]|nr:substrate-binding domain-containing protein [Marinihelvus fidelis]
MAGVSQATVSRALRDSPLVSEATREKVKQIARDLNYHVDRSAAGLRSGQTRTLAVLLFEDDTIGDASVNPYFLSMLGHITRSAARRDYDVLVAFQQLSENWHQHYEISNRADGIILLGYGDFVSFDDKLERLRRDDAHFVVWGASAPGLDGRSVGCENRLGGEIATRHLLSLGRRRIAFFGEMDERCPEFRDRYDGYTDALNAEGIDIDPALQFDARGKESLGVQAVEQLLASGTQFDAIFAASDLIAIGAIAALHEAGLSVPGDVSVVGYDDIHAASCITPALTTIRQDPRAAAGALVDLLLTRIAGGKGDSRQLPPQLIVRKSCGSDKIKS